MIKVAIFNCHEGKPDILLGEMEITRLPGESRDELNEVLYDYSVRYGAEVGGGNFAMYQRVVRNFRRERRNIFSLVYYALCELGPEKMGLEGGLTRTSDMEGRFSRGMREVQAWTSKLRHH